MIDSIGDGPHVIRILGDMDGWARWRGEIKNHDSKYEGIEVLVYTHEETGVMELATRPAGSGASWSPPIKLDRT